MIGVIADDLSGAAEIGAVGLRYGLRAEILVLGSESRLQAAGRGEPAKAGTPNMDLVCIDTDSRGCTAQAAARRATAAAKLLRKFGTKWIYKKVDSVLRGQVAGEIQAIRKELRLKTILLHPANPSLGRTIKGGKYFIHGKLIHKTEFANDPAHPRKTADVCKLLGRVRTFPVQVGKLTEPLADSGVIICESTSSHDVQSWVERARPEMLLAGGAEFFAALLAARTTPSPRPREERAGVRRSTISKLNAPLPAQAGRGSRQLKDGSTSAYNASLELFVCGTTSKSSQKFIRAARQAGTPVFSLPPELALGVMFTGTKLKALREQVWQAFQKHPRVILQTGLPAVSEPVIAKNLAAHLTRLAKAILNQAALPRVYAEGGATALELVRRMGWTRLTVLREVAPGVATLTVGDNQSLQLTIKPGSYVWPEEIQRPPAPTKIKKINR